MKLVPESLLEYQEFERGADDIHKQIGIGRVRSYPQMTPDQFKRWFDDEIGFYLTVEDEYQAIADNLIGNTWETDSDVYEYLRLRNIEPELAKELIGMREYFNDKRYTEKLELPS